ncbi:MAG: hypothetical protein MZV70_66495 [Desulfobacterales bacterium]|nr:hypothetical protein [Desulfobacterales bacterium]
MAERLAIAEGETRPRLIKVPTVKPENLICLDIAKADLNSRELVKIIKTLTVGKSKFITLM